MGGLPGLLAGGNGDRHLLAAELPGICGGSEPLGRTEDDTIQMLVGDFQRIALYPAKGYQIPQPIPTEAGRAFETLVNLGYTAQLAK